MYLAQINHERKYRKPAQGVTIDQYRLDKGRARLRTHAMRYYNMTMDMTILIYSYALVSVRYDVYCRHQWHTRGKHICVEACTESKTRTQIMTFIDVT